MRTVLEQAVALVKGVDSHDTPRALFRKLADLLPRLGEKPGTQVTLERLCAAEKAYRRAIEDAKFILEVV